MPKFGAQIDTQRTPVKGLMAEQNASALGTPVEGLMWHDTANKVVKIWLNGAWMTLGAAGAGGPPSGNAGGDLGSTFPNPTVVKGQAGFTVGGTAVVLTSDARLSDARPPSGVITGDLTGSTWPALNVAANAITSAKILNGTIVVADLDLTSVKVDTIGAPTSGLMMNGGRVTVMADPQAAQDAATKNYVDNVAQGLDAKPSVRLASASGNVPLSGLTTVDGILPVAGDRCLLKNQTAPAENGIWVAASGAWTRATDMDSWGEFPGAFVWAEEGGTNADTGWVCTNNAGGTVGTTAVTWVQFSSAGTQIAGAGLTKTGNTLDVGAGTGVTVAADTVAVDTAVIAARSYVDTQDGLAVPKTTTISTTAPLTIGGGASADLSANRTLAVNTFTSGAAGVVPASGGGSTTFMRADGTWAAPAGGGTVNKYAANCPALTAGVESSLTHNLNTLDIVPNFIQVSNGEVIALTWRASGANTIAFTADIAYGAAALRAVVLG